MREVLEDAAYELALLGWTLRHGFAPGADQACHAGALRGGGRIDAFLPWAKYERAQLTALAAHGPHDRPAALTRVFAQPSPEAYEIAARFHPAWHRLPSDTRALHARNAHQILGEDLQAPVRFVLCWTADGSLDGADRTAGGSGQALRIAVHYEIPVLNICRPEHFARVTRRAR